MWLLNSNEFRQRNMRLITKLESFKLSKYLVRTWLVDLDMDKFCHILSSLIWKLHLHGDTVFSMSTIQSLSSIMATFLVTHPYDGGATIQIFYLP